jgi:hypothetical protein
MYYKDNNKLCLIPSLPYINFFRDKMKVRLPDLVRQFSAEVLGTFLLVLFGDGAIAQVVLGILSNKIMIYNSYSLKK